MPRGALCLAARAGSPVISAHAATGSPAASSGASNCPPSVSLAGRTGSWPTTPSCSGVALPTHSPRQSEPDGQTPDEHQDVVSPATGLVVSWHDTGRLPDGRPQAP